MYRAWDQEAIDYIIYSIAERSSRKEKSNCDEHGSMHAFGKKDSKDFMAGGSKLDNTCSESESYIGCEESNTEEAWSGSRPSVEYFRVFRCVAHVHVLDVKRQKLDAKSLAYVFLGVSEESKAYKLYDLAARKIVVSRDVVFEEDKSWSWDRSYEEHIMVDLEWDDKVVNVENEEVVSGKEGEVIESVGSPQNEENKGRNKVPPSWMRDYVTGEGLLEESENEDVNINLALFSSNPVHFEEAVKHDKWRTAMDM